MNLLGVVRKLRHALGGEGGRRICDSPNTKFFFLWKICDKGGGRGGQKIYFFCDVICERPLRGQRINFKNIGQLSSEEPSR